MINGILDQIIEYDTITIFRHERADGDAFGSQCGLALWLRKYFPEKNIYCLGQDGEDNLKQFLPMDNVDDHMIESSLAIILDTANTARIDDQRYKLAKNTIKIDHHVIVEHFGNIELVDTNKASTCELVFDVIQSYRPLTIDDSKIAEFLYKGLLTDTIRFSTSNTKATTVLTASKLLACGLNAADISFEMFKRSKNYFKLTAQVRNIAEFELNDALVYVYLDQTIIKKHGVDQNEAKDVVNEFNTLSDLKVWVLFIEDDEKLGLYNASIRARGLRIDDIANKFGGGGHHQAAGIKHLSQSETKRLLDMIKERISEKTI